MWFSIAFPLLALVVSSAAQCPINDAATNLILDYEKFNSTPYDDGYGCWTLGYGHRVSLEVSQGAAVWLMTVSVCSKRLLVSERGLARGRSSGTHNLFARCDC